MTELHNLNARRAKERKAIRDIFSAIGEEARATVTVRPKKRTPGYSGPGYSMVFSCHGVGASVTISDLHDGGWEGLISWHNDYSAGRHPCRDFSSRFFAAVGDHKASNLARHKATSFGTWARLAGHLTKGLALAAAGEAFEKQGD